MGSLNPRLPPHMETHPLIGIQRQYFGEAIGVRLLMNQQLLDRIGPERVLEEFLR
jgi:hypothetical protein